MGGLKNVGCANDTVIRIFFSNLCKLRGGWVGQSEFAQIYKNGPPLNKKIKVGKKLHFCITLKPVCDNILTNTSAMSSLVGGDKKGWKYCNH